jgi:hypothetical protein
VQAAAPESRNTLEQELNNINTLMEKVGANDPAQIAAAANRAAQTVDALLARIMAQKIEPPFAGTLLHNISGDSAAIAGGGFRVAEQAFMAVQTFVPVAQKNGKSLGTEPVIQNAIDALSRSVEKPAMYDPQQFATQMRAIHRFLIQ